MVGAEADDWATGAEEEITAEDTATVSAKSREMQIKTKRNTLVTLPLFNKLSIIQQ
jgi:hypothetical protein